MEIRRLTGGFGNEAFLELVYLPCSWGSLCTRTVTASFTTVTPDTHSGLVVTNCFGSTFHFDFSVGFVFCHDG